MIILLNQGRQAVIGIIDDKRIGISVGYLTANVANPIDIVTIPTAASKINSLLYSCHFCCPFPVSIWFNLSSSVEKY